MKIKTTVGITEATKILIDQLVKEMDIPKTTFYKRAISYFIEYDSTIHPYLLITKREHPNYVRKIINEQIYVEENSVEKLKEIAKENNCKWTITIFQALITYCCVMAPVILPPESEWLEDEEE